jgi:hypothetical protein
MGITTQAQPRSSNELDHRAASTQKIGWVAGKYDEREQAASGMTIRWSDQRSFA